MYIIIKKKKIIVFILSFIIVVVGILCSFHNTKTTLYKTDDNNTEEDLLPGEAVIVNADNDLLAKAKIDKEISRSETTEILRSIIDNSNTSDEIKKSAESKILEIANNINSESQIETLLMTKGFNDCVVFISDDNVNITIKGKKLSKSDISKINDISFEITGNNNIKIVEVR